MEILHAVMLGVIQGVFEWLPVSSEAVISLVMTQFLGVEPIKSVNAAIFLHIGTMLAALLYFREDFIEVVEDLPSYFQDFKQNPNGKLRETNLINFLGFSTLITGLVGGSIYVFGRKAIPESPEVFSGLVGGALLLTGLMKLKASGSSRSYIDAGFSDSILVGFLQGLAVIPGISRSGSTVFGLFYRDFSSEDAFRLSFLMSVPAVVAAQVGLNLFSGFQATSGLLVASLTAAIVGYVSIGAVLEIAEKVEVAYLCFFLAALSFVPLLL